MASAGTVTVDFAAETARFTSELKKVGASLRSIEDRFNTLEKVGRVAFRFFTAGAIFSFVRSAVSAADALGDAAERAGIAVESFSRLQFAAGRADVEVSAFTTGVTKFQVAISKASEGNKEALSTFALLNIEISKLKDLSIEEQFGTVADAFREIKDPADRTRIAVELFGRAAGPQMVPLLAQGSEGIKKLTDQADRLGITMTESAAKGIDRATKALEGFIGATKQAIASRIGDLVTSVFGSGDDVVDLEFRIRNLQELLRGLQQAPVPDTERIRVVTAELKQLTAELTTIQRQATQFTLLPLPWINAVEEIDLTAIQDLKINVDDLAIAFQRLNQSIAEIQQARSTESLQLVNEAVLEGQRQIEQLATAEFQAELDQRSAAAQANRAFELQQEQALQQSLQSLRTGTVNAAIGALQAFAGHSKKAAIALVLINKARAISSVIQDTAAAAAKALAVYGPTPAGFAAAGAAKAFGAAQIALIAAAGFGEIKSINAAGGAPLGSPANPINTQSQLSDQQQFGAAPQAVTQVIIANNNGWDQRVIDQIIDGIKEAVDDRDVVIFGPESRQAKELVLVDG